MGYKDIKNNVASYLVGEGFTEIPFNLNNDETTHSLLDKGFSIKAYPIDYEEVLGGGSIGIFGMTLAISFITTTNEEYDDAYDRFIEIVGNIQDQTRLVDSPSFVRMEEINYHLGTANFYAGSTRCE